MSPASASAPPSASIASRALPPGGEIGAPLLQHLALRREIALCLQQIRIRGRRQFDDVAEFRQRSVLDRQLLQIRREPPHALELRAQRFEPALVGTHVLDLLLDRLACFLAVDPVPCAHLNRFQIANRFVEGRLGHRERAAAAPRRPQLERARLQFLAHGPEAPHARRRFEQHLAELVGRIEDAPAARRRPRARRRAAAPACCAGNPAASAASCRTAAPTRPCGSSTCRPRWARRSRGNRAPPAESAASHR